MEKKIERKLNLNDKLKLEKHMRDMPFSSLEEAKESLNLPYSKKSLSGYCKTFGLRRGITPKKFCIKPMNCELRVNFVRRRLSLSLDLWEKIVFTDESGIDNSGFQKRHVWRPANSRYDDTYIYRALNMTLRVNYFSWITITGTGRLLTYDKMNCKVYCQEILPVMIRDLKEQFGENFLVIHDNARFSNSEFTKKYLVENDLKKYFITIPLCSPDMNIPMNIIENVWAILKQRVRKHCFVHGQTKARSDFIELINFLWSDISVETIEKLYNYLPFRMPSILRSDEKLTKY